MITGFIVFLLFIFFWRSIVKLLLWISIPLGILIGLASIGTRVASSIDPVVAAPTPTVDPGYIPPDFYPLLRPNIENNALANVELTPLGK